MNSTPKPSKNAGKGMKPITGYNPSNWYKNYPAIDWGHKPTPKPKKDKSNA